MYQDVIKMYCILLYHMVQVSPSITWPRHRPSFRPGNGKGRRSHTAWRHRVMHWKLRPLRLQNGKASWLPLGILYGILRVSSGDSGYLSLCFSMFLWSQFCLEVSEMQNDGNRWCSNAERYMSSWANIMQWCLSDFFMQLAMFTTHG